MSCADSENNLICGYIYQNSIVFYCNCCETHLEKVHSGKDKRRVACRDVIEYYYSEKCWQTFSVLH